MANNMATFNEFDRIDMRTGLITDVEDFPRAKNPSYRLTIDFGPDIGIRRSSVQATNYSKDELRGMRIVAVVNFAPKNIAGFMSEVLVLGVPGDDGSIALLTPSRPAVIGGRVY
ncbi:MAG TPA: tRNA-binding protein [Chloroflexota bacterium]|nr:tRNA-binding protein [Chloroflexota bacterium]